MNSTKTAISLQKSLLDRVDTLAQELDISRSRLFTLAVEDFIQRHKNQKLFEAINSAYDDTSDPEEQIMLQKMRRKHKELVKEQW